MHKIKELIKKIVPTSVLLTYHKILAVLAARKYEDPSEQLIVIGVTGTNGKSTTCNLIAQLLESAGKKVGLTTTVNFKIGEKEWLNDKKMTMLGRLQLQKFLRQMVDEGCEYAVIETSSQGIEQFRHAGINYDVAVFTNLTPEHIEAHGGFDNYKAAKGKLFSHLTDKPYKEINGQMIPKIIVANADDEHVSYFLNFQADKKLTFGINSESDYQVEALQFKVSKTFFKLYGKDFQTSLIGEFNLYNILAAVATARALGISLDDLRSGVLRLKGVPGRMERIDEGQNFTVIVDYAPEPGSLDQLYKTLKLFEINRIIHVLGSCGGGRDVARQPVMGKMVGEFADVVIVTNEDPYDDDPMAIINNIASGALEAGKVEEQDLFKILSRKAAIEKAISLAQEGDLVLITGKGAEQAMAVAGGKHVPWDDRAVSRGALKQLTINN